MFTANTQLQVSEISYDTILSNLKTFLKNKTEFADYDFDGSTISYVLKTLAYDTYMKSFYVNMAVNESYLDTAQIRANVISNAKKLGYVPVSARSATTQLSLSFSPGDTPSQIVIPQYTKFKGVKNGVTYFFVTKNEYSIIPAGGVYSKTIDVYEGTVISQTFTYSSSQTFYELLNGNVDSTSIVVAVKPNSVSTSQTIYTEADDITELTSSSEVFFLQENSSERYEIYFGNGVLGKALSDGNIITVTYIVTRGTEGNDVQGLTNVSYSGYNVDTPTTQYVPATINQSEKTHSGTIPESLDSIKFNAPRYYTVQNRLVTINDYISYALKNYSFIEAINAWGGDTHVPPVYGKVILSIKPTGGYVLSQARKDVIIADMEKRSVMSIEPIIIDPIFVYINPIIDITYDSFQTTLSPESLFSKIQTTVANFETSNLSIFDRSFRYSQFIKAIDNTDTSILSNETEINLEKRISPILNSTISYVLRFDAALRNLYAGYLGCVTSTGFKINTNSNTLFLDDDGNGKIRTYYLSGQSKVYVNSNAGTINYLTGEIKLTSFHFTSVVGDELRVIVQPDKKNFTPLRNQIVLLSNPLLSLFNIRANQITKSGILDVNGNLSPVSTNYIDVPVIL